MSEDCRRKYVRFPANALVWWTKDWEAEPIALVDISAGGMLCEFPTALNLGVMVSLQVEFPGHSGLILCHCQVAHCRQGEGPYFLMGLRIVSLEGMEQTAFIHRLKTGISG